MEARAAVAPAHGVPSSHAMRPTTTTTAKDAFTRHAVLERQEAVRKMERTQFVAIGLVAMIAVILGTTLLA